MKPEPDDDHPSQPGIDSCSLDILTDRDADRDKQIIATELDATTPKKDLVN